MHQVGTRALDWDIEEGYSEAEREKYERLYESTLTRISEQEIIRGQVVMINDREVIVNIGFKSEGIIPIQEFRDVADLKVGDPVEVYLETIEDKTGQMILSRKMASTMRTWERINSAHSDDIIVEGVVVRRTKGGFVVDLDGIEAFLPGSQIDVKPIRDYDAYVGQRMEFKIVKINHQQHNVVISHKALIEKDLEVQKAGIINNLQKGQILEGTVKNITSFGVFIDLGGVDGLLHITDISWGRVNAPEELLTLDQKVNVVVLDFDEEKKRISLGMKQLLPHPWDSATEGLEVGSRVRGKVVTIADYGIFIEIVPGVEGLIHVSEMSWSQHPRIPSEVFNIGDEVEAVVLTLEKEERKMSLGIKQLTPDPWEQVETRYPVNSKHVGIVRNIMNYGLFVELEEGIDGLIHVQDLSWSKKINHPAEFINKDEKLDVIVLEIDKENRKLRLGHKQVAEDPWETLELIFPIDSVHTGTITKISDKNAQVELQYGIEGTAPLKHLQVKEGQEMLKEGDTAEFKVIEFSKENRKIVLSHYRVWKDKEEAEAAGAKKAKKGGEKKKAGRTSEKTTETLGDNEALAALKAQMIEGEKDTIEAEALPEIVTTETQTAVVPEATQEIAVTAENSETTES